MFGIFRRRLSMSDRIDLIFHTLRAIARDQEKANMATKEHLDALNATVAANTSAVAAAQAALTGYVQTVADLTKKLQDAIAGDDDAAVADAVNALAANNSALMNAVPSTAAAVVAGTPAAV